MTDKPTLIDAIAKTDMFSIFSRLMGTSGANEIFDTGKDFTVFVPTNDAFGKIPEQNGKADQRERPGWFQHNCFRITFFREGCFRRISAADAARDGDGR